MMHGRHEPAWDYYSDFINYTSRMQYVGQTGVPQIDLAFYFKDVNFQYFTTGYSPNDLQQAGFTYNYLAPENFELPNAFVSNGVLDPNGQAYKALVVQGNASLTVAGAQKINEYAKTGLPIVFSGGVPTNVSGFAPSASAYVSSLFSDITSLPNVHQVGYEGLAQAMISLGITPRAAVSANSTWYSNWRKDESSTNWVSFYNDATGAATGAGYAVGNVTIEASGTPYFYDAWTGQVTPVRVYSTSDNTTTVPLQLAGNQTVLISFSSNTTAEAHSDSTSYQYPAGNGSCILVTADDPAPPSASNSTSSTPSAATTLGPWSLIVESWTAPSNLEDITTIATKTNSSAYSLSSIVPWSSIDPALTTVSGRGYYTTNFTWSSNSSSSSGAFLDIGPIFHVARASINGHQLPPLDVTNAYVDIGPYLVDGTNQVEIIVATPLGNALNSIWQSLLTSGRGPGTQPPPPLQAYGLLRGVRIVPYVEVSIA